jgi:AbrB family looped-hinge helix DNA binding protein
MPEATLSSKNQIVVPREAREALGVHAGDKLLIVVRGNTVVILPRPDSWTKALRGLAKEVYPASYLDNERASWE